MRTEVLSTGRPSALRLLGFLALVVGGVLAGAGATMTWARVGFPGDATGVADVAVKGIDVWEGVVVLAIAAAALILTVVMRITPSHAVRVTIAAAVLVGGFLVSALAALDIATARSRFGGGEGLDEIARAVANELGQPMHRVRALLEQTFGAELRVDVGAGLWLALAGGVFLALAGALSLLWVRERRGPADAADPPVAGDV